MSRRRGLEGFGACLVGDDAIEWNEALNSPLRVWVVRDGTVVKDRDAGVEMMSGCASRVWDEMLKARLEGLADVALMTAKTQAHWSGDALPI